MAHKDSKSTIQSTPRENIIYYDDTKNSISFDDNNLLGNTVPENTGSDSFFEAIPPKEPDPEDVELINMLKSDEGSDIIHILCKSDSVRNILISYMQDSNNPELRKVLNDSIFAQYFDSTQSNIKSDSLTPITNLLKFQHQNNGLLSNILVKMQSNILIKHLLDECINSNSPDVRSFVIDTLVRMDSQLVVSEILDQQEQSDLLNDLLIKISKKSDFEEIYLQTNKTTNPDENIPLEATEPKQIVATRPGPKATTSEPFDKNSQELDSEDYEQSYSLGFWDRIKDNISQVIEPVSKILEADWVHEVFRIDWIKDAVNKAISYIEKFDPREAIHEIRSSYDDIVGKKHVYLPEILSVSHTSTNATLSLVDFLQDSSEPEAWELLKEFFISCPDPNSVRMLLIELKNAPPEIRSEILELIVKMDSSTTVPILLEENIDLADKHLSCNEILKKIEERQSNDEVQLRKTLDSEAILRRQERAEIPRPKGNVESNESPPNILKFLDSKNEKLNSLIAHCLASSKNIDRHIPVILKEIVFQIENDRLSETATSNAVELFKSMGNTAVPFLIEYQDQNRLDTIISQVLDFSVNQSEI